MGLARGAPRARGPITQGLALPDWPPRGDFVAAAGAAKTQVSLAVSKVETGASALHTRVDPLPPEGSLWT